MLCDLPGVLSFLGLPPETEMPPGNKGKTKLKKLYRKVAPNKAYHSGERAKDLISHLDMAEIRASSGHRRPSKNWDAVQYELGALFV